MGLPLYLIERVDRVGYDEACGFVVAAENEDVVRVLLSSPSDADEEESSYNTLHAGDEGVATWLDPTKAVCELIAHDSVYDEPRIVMKDFRAG
jgi:hypothetical protein